MKRFANFIVSKRYWILGVMLALTIVCMFLSQMVEVNTDMTKYLPDDSPMKMGMTIMKNEFPEMEMTGSIRVMAQNLSDEQKAELQDKLEKLPYVDSVTHNNNEEYNKDIYSLFVINTSFDYGTPEEISIENALANDFSEYQIVYQNGDMESEGLSKGHIILALAALILILFIMSSSWIEPVLFMLTIGLAVVLNSGTNIILGEVSETTASISAILQLVLSMDYSIILLNRYRQEKENSDSNQAAMISAVEHSFVSIASSSLTTVVGLLVLVFMNFKIGKDIGIVLGKGVFISMVCVIAVLPCLMLLCDKLIVKTAKRSLHIPTKGLAGFVYRFRYVAVFLFILAFLGFNQLQGNTEIAYTLEKEDSIAEVFPNDNMLLMLYDNQDEDKIAKLIEELENYDGVKQVMGYPNLLGKPYIVQELSNVVSEMSNTLGADMGNLSDIDPTLHQLIYYVYYDGKVPPMTMGTLLGFLSEDVLTNETFAESIDADMREQISQLLKFSDPKELTSSKSVSELAAIFGMEEETVKNLMLYYYSQSKDVETGL